MKEEKLWNALTEIDRDLILDAAQPLERKPYRNRLPLRIALIAAVISLLSLTVAGLSIGIRYFSDMEPETVAIEYYPGVVFSGESYGATVKFNMEPQEITLPEEWLRILRQAWDSFPYDKAHFPRVELREDGGGRKNLGTLSAVETLLGIPLTHSPEIDGATIGVFGELVLCDPVETEKALNRGETLYPDGILLYVTLDPGELEERTGQLTQYFTLKVYIPLTTVFESGYGSMTVQPEADGGRFRATTVNSAGRIQVSVLESTWESEYSQFYTTYGLWEHKGIAYVLEAAFSLGDPLWGQALLEPYVIRLEEGK